MFKELIISGAGGEGGTGILGFWGRQTVLFGMDGQWDPTVQLRELCAIGSLCCITEFDDTLCIHYNNNKKRNKQINPYY